MPGLNGTGPTGRGPMTGGARGMCSPDGGYSGRAGFDPNRRGAGGRGRGYRRMNRATGFSGWMRSEPAEPPTGAGPMPSSREDQKIYLKDRMTILKKELDAIDRRIRDLESEPKKTE